MGDDVIHRGSGDFLADQGMADPDEFRVKAHLCNEIASVIAGRGLSDDEVADATGLEPADVSRIVNSRFEGYSVWRLMKVLAALGSDIVIGIMPATDAPGVITTRALPASPER